VNFPGYTVATQYQQGWSRLHGVNLIVCFNVVMFFVADNIWQAANTGNLRSNGGGIFSAGNIVNIAYEPLHTMNTVLGAKLDTPPSPPLIPTPPLEPHNTSIYQEECTVSGMNGVCAPIGGTAEGAVHAAHGPLHCTAQYSIANSNSDVYVLFAFHGTRIFPDTDPLHLEICMLMRCENAPNCTTKSLSATTVFSSFELFGHFDKDTQVLPLVAVEDGKLVDGKMYHFQEQGYLWTAQEFTQPLYSAALWGVVSYMHEI